MLRICNNSYKIPTLYLKTSEITIEINTSEIKLYKTEFSTILSFGLFDNDIIIKIHKITNKEDKIYVEMIKNSKLASVFIDNLDYGIEKFIQ
jgi:hypothetical protein